MKYILEYSALCDIEIEAKDEAEVRDKFKKLVREGIDIFLNDDSYAITYIYPKE